MVALEPLLWVGVMAGSRDSHRLRPLPCPPACSLQGAVGGDTVTLCPPHFLVLYPAPRFCSCTPAVTANLGPVGGFWGAALCSGRPLPSSHWSGGPIAHKRLQVTRSSVWPCHLGWSLVTTPFSLRNGLCLGVSGPRHGALHFATWPTLPKRAASGSPRLTAPLLSQGTS